MGTEYENLKALVYGVELTKYQKALAIDEFHKMINTAIQAEKMIEKLPITIHRAVNAGVNFMCDKDHRPLFDRTDEYIKKVMKDFKFE